MTALDRLGIGLFISWLWTLWFDAIAGFYQP